MLGHKRKKIVNSSRIWGDGEDHAAPGMPPLLGGALKHVESLRREGPCLHASQRTIDSVPSDISIRSYCGVRDTIHRCLIITNRLLAIIEFSAFLASGTPEAPGAHNEGYRRSWAF